MLITPSKAGGQGYLTTRQPRSGLNNAMIDSSNQALIAGHISTRIIFYFLQHCYFFHKKIVGLASIIQQ